MKILHPHGELRADEIEEIPARFAIEGRKRVKDQIIRIDTTGLAAVNFTLFGQGAGEWHAVTTLEEDEHPTHYNQSQRDGTGPEDASGEVPSHRATAAFGPG